MEIERCRRLSEKVKRPLCAATTASSTRGIFLGIDADAYAVVCEELWALVLYFPTVPRRNYWPTECSLVY